MHNGVLTTQPKTSVVLNRGSPLVRGLKFAGHRGAWLDDPSNGISWSTTGTMTHGSSQYGQAWGTDGTASYISKTGDLLNTASKVFSFMCVATPRGTLQTDRRIMALGLSSSLNPIISIGTGGVASRVRIYFRDINGNFIGVPPEGPSGELASGKTEVFIFVASGDGNAYGYTRGGVISASKAPLVASTATDNIALGCLIRTSAGSFFQGDYSMWAGWDRELSLHEINMLRANPFQLFAAPSQSSMNLIRAAYVPPASGGHPTRWRFGGVPGMGQGQSFGRSW